MFTIIGVTKNHAVLSGNDDFSIGVVGIHSAEAMASPVPQWPWAAPSPTHAQGTTRWRSPSRSPLPAKSVAESSSSEPVFVLH